MPISVPMLKKLGLNRYLNVLDLETLGTSGSSKVGAIGIVTIDLIEMRISDHLYIRVEHDSQPGRTSDESTLLFWAEQQLKSPGAWREMFDPSLARVSLVDALTQVEFYLDEKTPSNTISQVVGNGSEFDNVILKSCYDDCGIDLPWSFRGNQSLRTFMLMGEIFFNVNVRKELEFEGILHHALDDAMHEAKAAIGVLKRFLDLKVEEHKWFYSSLSRALGVEPGCYLDLPDLLSDVEALKQSSIDVESNCNIQNLIEDCGLEVDDIFSVIEASQFTPIYNESQYTDLLDKELAGGSSCFAEVIQRLSSDDSLTRGIFELDDREFSLMIESLKHSRNAFSSQSK